MPRLKIATFNTWNCQGRFDRRMPLMVEGLRALDADVLLLQEVFSQVPSGFDLGDRVARELGLHIASAPARQKLRKLNGAPVLSHSGLAVLSKAPIVAATTVRLPEDARDGERLGQVVRVDANGLGLVIANVHLSHLPGADDLRRRQLSVLLGRVPHDYELLVLGGDLNMDAAHHDLNTLCQSQGFAPAGFPTKFTPRTTLNPIGGQAFQTGIIDHLFVKSSRAVCACAHARVALDEPDPKRGHFPSDHKAVVAEVTHTPQSIKGCSHDVSQCALVS